MLTGSGDLIRDSGFYISLMDGIKGLNFIRLAKVVQLVARKVSFV